MWSWTSSRLCEVILVVKWNTMFSVLACERHPINVGYISLLCFHSVVFILFFSLFWFYVDSHKLKPDFSNLRWHPRHLPSKYTKLTHHSSTTPPWRAYLLRAVWKWTKSILSFCFVDQRSALREPVFLAHTISTGWPQSGMIIMPPYISRTFCIFSENFNNGYLSCSSQEFSLWNSFAYFIYLQSFSHC